VKCSFVAAEVKDASVAVDAESLGCCVSCLTLLVNGKQSCGGGDMMDQSTNEASKRVEWKKRSNQRPAARMTIARFCWLVGFACGVEIAAKLG
jgi:hypothetical protein